MRAPVKRTAAALSFMLVRGLMVALSQTQSLAALASSGNAALPPSQQAWQDSVKHPASWLSWGADLRLRWEFLDNVYLLNSDAPAADSSYQRYRPRIWTTLAPLRGVEINTRLSAEFRTYQRPVARRGVDWDEVLFDNMNLRFTNLLGQPLALTVGRQDLAFGNKWLVFDSTSADGSRTEFFDAARLNWDWREAKTGVDAIYLDSHRQADWLLPVISPTGLPLMEQDERGAILYLSNKSLPQTRIDGYFIYRHEYHPLPKIGDQGDLYVFGARAEGELSKHWKYQGEFAQELGRKNDRSLNAFGFNGRFSYFARDRWNHNFRLGYEYLSGDDPNTRDDEGWDAMWARRFQWSELLVFTFTTEGGGRKTDWSNLQRLDAGWSFNPSKKVEIALDYMPLFANSNPLGGTSIFNTDGRFRGHLLAAVAKFTFSKSLSAHLWSEFFFPGDYYASSNRDMATFLRAQVMWVF